MFTVTFGQIRSKDFARALRMLMQIRALPTVTSTNIVKIFKFLQEEEKTVKELYDRIIDDYVEKDADGKIVFAKDEEGNEMPGFLKVLPGKSDELDAKIAEFDAQEVQVPRSHLNLEHVAQALSPHEIMILEPLWGETPDEDPKGAHLKRV